MTYIKLIIFSLSSREWAILFFFSLLVVYGMVKAPNAALRVIKATTRPKLLIIFFCGFIYLIFCTRLLYDIGLWNSSLLKDTIVYILTSASLITKSILETDCKKLFINQILKNITLTTIIAYFINLYSFPFWAELLLLIIYSISINVKTYAIQKNREQNQNVIVFFKKIIMLIYLIYSIGFVHWLVNNGNSIFSKTNFYCLLFPIILGIMFIPYMFTIALYSSYELIFTRIDTIAKNTKRNSRFRKLLIFKTFSVRINKIKTFEKSFHMYGVDNDTEFAKYVKLFAKTSSKKRE